jgi:hypothetical protein
MIALDQRTKSRLIFAGVLLMPLIAVQAARFLLGPQAGPGAAAAAVSPTAPPPGVPQALVPAPLLSLTPRQNAVVEWLASAPAYAALRSPMDRPEAAPPPAPRPAPGAGNPYTRAASQPAPTDTPEASRPPSQPEPPAPEATASALSRLVLTGLLVNGRTRLAALNHRIYRVGDEVYPGWRVARIDSRTRAVTLVGPDGTAHTVATPPPELRQPPPLPPLDP